MIHFIFKKGIRMQYIQRLPFILGALAALAAGALGYIRGVQERNLYIRMAVSMLAFYAVGLLVRSALLSIKKEIDEKEALEKQNELEKQKELIRQKQKEIEEEGASDEKKFKGKNVDFRVDELTDEFTPFSAGNLHNVKKS